MGIKNFGTILKKATNGVSTATYQNFAGQTWAIDASIFCYRFAHNAQSKRPNSHIDGFYQLFLRLLKARIRPILVFDGKTPQEKMHTVELRARHKQKNLEKIEKLEQELTNLTGKDCTDKPPVIDQFIGAENEEDIKTKIDALTRAKKSVITFQPGFYDDVRMLCDLMNVPVLRANGEADVLCAKLYETGQVQAIMSEDSDILLYKGGCLIRKFGWTNEIEVLELNKILESLDITYDQFIDLAILCGTDYTPTTITGLGPLNALELITKGMNIEQIITYIRATNGKCHIPSETSFPYKQARELIKNACQLEQTVMVDKFDLKKVNFVTLTNIMATKCRYRGSTIQKHYDQLKEIYSIQRPKIKISIRVKNTFQ
jgi:flap endonuclease-1